MKKLMATFLILVLNFTIIQTGFATETQSDVQVNKVGGTEVIESRSKLHLQFTEDFNINKSEVGDNLTFILQNPIYDNNVRVLPNGTKFIGTVTHKEKSKWAFRRASAVIQLNRMILPDGSVYYVDAMQNGSSLKAPATLNVLKGISMASISGCVGMFGLTIIAVECLSIGGMLFAPATGAIVGASFVIVSKGLNYKAHAGTPVIFTLQSPISISNNVSLEQ